MLPDYWLQPGLATQYTMELSVGCPHDFIANQELCLLPLSSTVRILDYLLLGQRTTTFKTIRTVSIEWVWFSHHHQILSQTLVSLGTSVLVTIPWSTTG